MERKMDSNESIGGKTDKISRYGWTVQDKPGEFAMVDKNNIHVDMEYQRKENENKALEMAASWSWVGCGCIILAERDGKFYVVDGQHRVIAARRRSDIKLLPCLIFSTNGQTQEANGFLVSNTLRKPVSAIDKFRAMVVAGDDIAIYIKRVFDELGLQVSNSGSSIPGTIKCVALATSYATMDRDAFSKTIRFASKLCEDSVQISDKLLSGLYYINSHVSTGLDDKRLKNRMMEIGPKKLVEEAVRAAAYYARGGARIFAEGMLKAINKGIRAENHFIISEK